MEGGQLGGGRVVGGGLAAVGRGLSGFLGALGREVRLAVVAGVGPGVLWSGGGLLGWRGFARD